MPSLMESAARVRAAVFDVDGVLTDGRLYLGEGGQELKAFHSRDGVGLKWLQAGGVKVGVISGRRSAAVADRLEDLDVRHVLQGRDDKGPALEALCHAMGVTPADVAYLGDDVPDLAAMDLAGLPVAVADAHPWVLARAAWCTPSRGGHGAARELCELLLEARGGLARPEHPRGKP